MTEPHPIADLERRLRAEAADLAVRPPADLAQGIIAGLRDARPRREPPAAPAWRWWLPAALAAVVAVAVGIALMRPGSAREPDTAHVDQRPAPTPAVAPPTVLPATAVLARAPSALVAPTRALSSECRRMGDDVAAAYRVVIACVPSTPRPAAP